MITRLLRSLINSRYENLSNQLNIHAFEAFEVQVCAKAGTREPEGYN